MKCKNCGAPLSMTQRFCSNCGAPNEQSNQHIADMDNYQKKFRTTQKEVVSNSKWFIKYITPITVLTLSVIVAAVFWSGRESMWGYDMADRAKDRYNASHSTEIENRLNTLLANREYYALYAVHNNMKQNLSKERYQTDWRTFYNLSSYYSDLRKCIMVYTDPAIADANQYDSQLNRAASNIVYIEDSLYGKSASYEKATETIEPVQYMENAYHTFLKVYCQFTDEDIAGLSDKDQNAVLSLLMRRMIYE